MAREREPVRIAEALRDRGGLGCDRGGLLELPFGLVLIDEWHEQVAALDDVALLAVEQPLRATDPAARGADLAPREEAHSTPEGAADGRKRFARIEIGVVSPFESTLEIAVSPEHVRGGREQLEVGGLEWRSGVDTRQEVVRGSPGSTLVRLAAALEVRARCHGTRG